MGITGNFEGRFLILILVVLLGQVFWNCIFSSKKFPVLFFHVKFCSFCKKSWLRIVYLSKNPRQEKVGLPKIFQTYVVSAMHFGACFIHSLIFNCFFFVDFGPATLATLVGAGPIESLPLRVKAIGPPA